MNKWKHYAKLLYAGFISVCLTLCLVKESQAGVIRRLEITEDKAGVINLSLFRRTVISFTNKPEKAVPGSPGMLEVEFVGKDIVVRPLVARPCNLFVYTKTGRYVILFKITDEAHYDDVVTVSPIGSGARINLVRDSFTVQKVKLTRIQKKKIIFESAVMVELSEGAKRIESAELKEALSIVKKLYCTGCIVKMKPESYSIHCAHEIQKLQCKVDGDDLEIRRED